MAESILILTQYYPPETGAPQSRLSSLARHLSELGWRVTVLTAMPNYPKNEIYPAYKGKKQLKEVIQGIEVIRTWIYVSAKRNVPARLANYFSFVITAGLRGWRISSPDIIFCESPPLFLGLAAVLLKKKHKARLVFNVSDLWPESAVKLGIVTNKLVINLSYRLEACIYRAARLVTAQTMGIAEDIRYRFRGKTVYWLPNGFDFDDIKYKKIKAEPAKPRPKKTVFYAGIMGHAQGLEVILEAAAMLRHHEEVEFLIIGDGPEYRRLAALRERKKLTNVVLTGHLPRQQVLSLLRNSWASVIPLRKLDLFKGAIPSKIFEALAYEKPIILGVDGEARRLFIEKVQTGMYFEPENARALAQCIEYMLANPQKVADWGKAGYDYILNNFNRKEIAAGLHRQLLSLLTC